MKEATVIVENYREVNVVSPGKNHQARQENKTELHLISDPPNSFYPPTAFWVPLRTNALRRDNIEGRSDLRLGFMVLMIIKGLFRRYQRWNPVHPTSGAFWGMGIGFGCGVGWGPGFGPEVIGYVGAGCGVGFSVGITLAGFGIGLPANYVFEVPYNALTATRSGALDIARSSGLPGLRNGLASGWSNIVPHITDVQTKVLERFSSSKHKDSCNETVDLSKMQSIMSTHTRSILDNLRNFGARFSDHHKGLKD